MSDTPTPKSRALKMLWRAVFWVSFPFGILSFVLPIYGKELGATALEVGGFFSAMSFVPVVVRPFLGRALDRWGRRPFLLLGLLGYAVAMIVFCFADTVWLLTIARFVQGLGQAFLWLSAYAIVADVAAETGRGHDFGVIDEATNRGAIIGTTVGFTAIFTLEGFGVEWSQIWFWLFAAYTAPALLALWAAWRGVGETRPQVAAQPVESRPISGQLLALMVIVFVTGASSAMVWPLLMVFLQDALGAALGAALGPLAGGWLYDNLGHAMPFYLNTVVLLVGALLVAAVLRESRVINTDPFAP